MRPCRTSMKPSAFGWKLKPNKQETVHVFQKLGYGVFTESDHRILSNSEGHKVAATPDVAVVQLWNHQFAMPDSNQRHAVCTGASVGQDPLRNKELTKTHAGHSRCRDSPDNVRGRHYNQIRHRLVHGGGKPRSLQIFRTRISLISACRGIELRRFSVGSTTRNDFRPLSAAHSHGR
jgi:hypothetical protein